MASYKGRNMLHGINQQRTTNTAVNACPSQFVELPSVLVFLEHGFCGRMRPQDRTILITQ